MEKRLAKTHIPSRKEFLSFFEEDYLKEVFQKGAEAITRLIALLKSSPLTPNVRRELKVWLFNYLSRNAKRTLLDERRPIHLSPLEQRRSNQSEYYRMNGGAILPLIEAILETMATFPKERIVIDTIQPGHFSFLASLVFKETSFTDISKELQKSFPDRIGRFIEEVTDRHPDLIFGGEFTIHHQPFYLLTSKQNIDSLSKRFKTIQSGIGAVPDLGDLYHFLIESNFPFERLYSLSPISLHPVTTLQEPKRATFFKTRTTIASLYLEFFKHYPDLIEENPHIAHIIEIDQSTTLPLKRKIREIEEEVYLAFEELSLQQILRQTPLPSLQHSLQQVGPSSTYKKTTLYSNGMSGYFHVFKELLDFHGEKPSCAFLDSSYYEIVTHSLMGSALESFCHPTCGLTIDDFLDPLKGWEVLCMDLYPNFVEKKSVEIPPIEEILRLHLKKNPSSLTLVLDITGTVIHDEKLHRLVRLFDKEIEQGTLHLIFISSLAKYYTGGIDKYSGGFVQTYSTHFSLKTENLLSQPASTFFSLIFHEKGTWLHHYFRTIQKHHDLFYTLLLPLQRKESLIYLCRKEKEIPFIGLTFIHLARPLTKAPLTHLHLTNISYFLQYFLMAKSLSHDFPCAIRDSFGFPVTNLRNSGTALRLTVGLEDPPVLEEMAHWLIEEEAALAEEIHTLSDTVQSQTDFLLGMNPLFFSNWIDKMKLILVDYAKDHTLLETFSYLYMFHNPEQIFEGIFSSLSSTEKEWVSHWEKELIEMLQHYFFSQENLEGFVRHALLPLRPLLEKIYTTTNNPHLKILILKEKMRWLEFLTTHPLDQLESYLHQVLWIHETFAHLLLKHPTSQKELDSLKEEALAYAKDHPSTDLQAFLQSKVPCTPQRSATKSA
ncbi:MAG: hypothetical protein H7A38_04435 [Chlamydiales bacterium]|nr:hypothetical protein [Chlamydiales bacterium]